MNWERKWLADFNAEKSKFVLFDQSNDSDAFDVEMDGSVFEEEDFFKIVELSFASKLDWGSYIVLMPSMAYYCHVSGVKIRTFHTII